jgi:hypothetical protein
MGLRYQPRLDVAYPWMLERLVGRIPFHAQLLNQVQKQILRK